jgi:hypothetical protein
VGIERVNSAYMSVAVRAGSVRASYDNRGYWRVCGSNQCVCVRKVSIRAIKVLRAIRVMRVIGLLGLVELGGLLEL